MKPIVKIELPSVLTQDEAAKVKESLVSNSISEEYHVLVVVGNSEFVSIEIITASDINLHLQQK